MYYNIGTKPVIDYFSQNRMKVYKRVHLKMGSPKIKIKKLIFGPIGRVSPRSPSPPGNCDAVNRSSVHYIFIM